MAERFRAATRVDYEKFCVTEGWAKRKAATSKRGTDHVRYELALPDGRMLYTRISHPVNRDAYGANLWSHILRDQLLVTNTDFWACVNDRVVPNRGLPNVPTESIPLGLLHALIQQAGMAESEVKLLTKAEAAAKLADFYASKG